MLVWNIQDTFLFSELWKVIQTEFLDTKFFSKPPTGDQITKSTYNVSKMLQSKEKCQKKKVILIKKKKISSTFHGGKKMGALKIKFFFNILWAII